MPAEIINLFSGKSQPKQKRKSKKQVLFDLIGECAALGEPDMEMLEEILLDVDYNTLEPTDVFAMYLYRKKSRRR